MRASTTNDGLRAVHDELAGLEEALGLPKAKPLPGTPGLGTQNLVDRLRAAKAVLADRERDGEHEVESEEEADEEKDSDDAAAADKEEDDTPADSFKRPPHAKKPTRRASGKVSRMVPSRKRGASKEETYVG